MKVRLGAGTGVELLMSAMAVADPDWRAVLSHGDAAYDAALAAGAGKIRFTGQPVKPPRR